jgi:hypothetical protein
MRQVMKTIFLAGMVVFGLLQSVRAFTPAGPVGSTSTPTGNGDAWQIQNIGYGPPSDDVAPKNIGEEYRRNTPTLYYACDATFLDYFGSNGLAAVQGAFDIMNKTFTNNPTGMTNGLDGYSPTLSEFPLETRHLNFQAQALGLFDLKSFTLGILVRQMGLADPVQYTWTLHDRTGPLTGFTCPAGMEYLVVQRNFDTGGSPIAGSQTVSSLYSPYVNDVLYSYVISEACPASPAVLARTVPFPVNPLADTFSAVATLDGISWGGYYTGLTRDDVMGLRYLLQTNTINTESAAAGSLLLTSTTNFGSISPFPANPNLPPPGFGTFDLGALLSASVTNDPVTLETLFPGVIVASTTTNLAYVTNFTVVAFFTNFISSPVGSPPTLVIATNAVLSFEIVYSDTFANIVTNHYSPNSVVTLQTVTIGPRLGSIFGSPNATNTTSQTITLPGVPSGDYYIIPTNGCGIDIQSVFFTNVVSVTNVSSLFGTNAATATSTNSTGTTFQFSQVITQQTNYVFAIHPVTCTQTTNATGLYEGIQKINFVFTTFDALIGQEFQPITNNYTMVLVNSNGQLQTQNFQRIVTEPDFQFSASDQASGNAANPALVAVDTVSVPNFDTDNVLPGLDGPGTINPQTTISFDKVGPVFFNTTAETPVDLSGTNFWAEVPGNSVQNDLFYSLYFVWGSFDGTTNAPVVYPDGQSINNLGGMILTQITPATLPNGTNGLAYGPITFSFSGGSYTLPYTWSASGLPNGLSLSTGAVLSGTPTQTGTFVFTLTMTDGSGQSIQWSYPLTIQTQ